MTLKEWAISYALNALLWVWIAFFRGAERLEGTFLSGFLVWYKTPSWDAEIMRGFAYFMLLSTTIWFIFGLIFPVARFL